MQTEITLSTAEAEYVALSQALRSMIPIISLLKEFQQVFEKIELPKPKVCVKVYEDNAACLKFVRLPRLTPRTKHIAVPCHWFRTKVEEMEISIEPISTEKQLTGQFTKSLTLDKFLKGRKDLMGW